MPAKYVIGFDVGTGGCKGVLATTAGELVAVCFQPYPVHHPRPGWAEQDPEDWWEAVVAGTRELVASGGVKPGDIAAVGFAGQMLGLVPVDFSLRPLRPAIIWLDARAEAQARRIVRRLGGTRMISLAAGAVPSGKDVVCKILWMEENEPDLFADTWKFLDTTGYLAARATGTAVIDHTGAGGTGIINGKRRCWSRSLAALVGIPLEKMPEIRGSTEVVGTLRPEAAERMGLQEGIPVIAGMADIPAAATGSGALENGDAHINIGTSSWLCLSVSRPRNLGRNGFASVVSADPDMYILIGESETAGVCLDWFASRLWGGEGGEGRESLNYAELDCLVEEVEAGAGKLIFAPWIFGERAPVTDTFLRGAFINLSLGHGREHMLRAVYEGVGYNLRWLLEVVEKVGFPCPRLRAIGGGARSDAWMQIISDIIGRRVDAVEHPREAGALGCALAAAVGVGAIPSYREIKKLVKVRKSFHPRRNLRPVYDRMYAVFREIYPRLSRICAKLNRGGKRGSR